MVSTSRQKIMFLWGVALLSVLSFTACLSRHQLKLSGTIEVTEYKLSAPVSGRIASLTVDEGSSVKQGEVVATFERFSLAQKNARRVEKLLEQGGASQQQWEDAIMAANDQKIIAPLDGTILLMVHQQGEVVAMGSPIAIMGDLNHPWVKVHVAEDKISSVSLNQSATLHVDGLTTPIKGHVVFISPHAEFTPRNVQTPEERVTQVFAVKVALDDVPANVKPGVAADIILHLQKEAP